MAKRCLSDDPQTIHEDAWYYEERKGIYTVHKIARFQHVHLNIPWTMVARSVDRWRRDKAQRKARKP